jgi:arsenite/tail-anchored protein-transporting ATPase
MRRRMGRVTGTISATAPTSTARILLYTGKGGVGKTSVAAATAILCADRGLRTLVLSTDIAHSLADAFDRPLGPEPVQIAENLWGQEPDVYFNIARYWHTIQDYVAELFSWHGLDEVMAEEMTVLPGMDELGNLLWIADHVDSGNFDVIVVDAAPTGETLRLLSLPEASRWWVERVAPIGRRVSRLGGPFIQRMIGMPVPDEEVFHAADRLLRRLDDLRGMLTNPLRTSVRMVLGLDKLAVQEARRSFTYFHLFGYPSDLVVANRVLPADAGGWFQKLRDAQQRYLPEVEQEFGPVPVRTVPQFDHEMVGMDPLRELGRSLFDNDDPTRALYTGKPYQVRRVAGGYTVLVDLPFATRDSINLARQGDELLLQVDGWRRTLLLPRALLGARTRGASMDGHTLRVDFEARESQTAGGRKR